MNLLPENDQVRILIVEDSPTQAERLRHILVQRQFDVTHAAHGGHALDALRRRKADVIISDVVMPEVDGYELSRRVKADEHLADIPIILVTTLSHPEDVIRGLQCGAQHFILKPYDERHLVNLVQFALLNRGLRQSENGGGPAEIVFNGQRHVITANRLQTLHLLLSTYEAAIRRNDELAAAEERARRAESFLGSVIENVPSSIFVKDAADLRYLRVNRAFEQVSGRPRAEIVGARDHDLFPAAAADFLTGKDREALTRETVVDVAAWPLPTPTGGVRFLHIRKLRMLDGAVPKYVLGISDDITVRRAAEEALAAAKVEAERASRAKSDFLSRMSHDLRTPLNAILGFAQLLEMDGAGPEQRENAAQIVKAGRHLLGLINEVLDIARIEAGHLSLAPDPQAVEELVQQAVDLVRPLAAERQVTFEVETGCMSDRHVLADRQRLNQVLLNFLANAVKYNRQGGRVTITCTEAAERRLRIAVSDTGDGIPREKVSLLFQPFERLGAEHTGTEGTGLGLTLSKALVEAMGGHLGVESEVGTGSTFWLELPEVTRGTVTATAVPLVGAPVPARHAAAGTVLYIEDNLSNQRLLERVLARRSAIRLVTAGEGQTGVELARAERPDLILLDLHLPDIQGEEVLRLLRDDPRTRRIPVAVLSADATAAQTRRLLTAGATSYLTKPIDIAEILKLLDDTLQHATRPGDPQ